MSQNFRDRFEYLLFADPAGLTPDDRASLASLLAETDEIFGLAVDTAERRWARNARLLRRHVRDLGRVPTGSDPRVGAELLTWIEHQDPECLNSYQRARLEAIPGWQYPSRP